MRLDSPGCRLGDVSLSGPGCKDGALWLWNSCVEESQGSWVKPCLELGRNEKVLITTLMPACQSPAGLSRPGGRVTADWSEAGWFFRSIAESQTAPDLVVKYESCSRTYFAPRTENKLLLKKNKTLSVCISSKGKSPVTAGCQSWLFLTVQEHKSGLMYITNPTTLHNLNLFF